MDNYIDELIKSGDAHKIYWTALDEGAQGHKGNVNKLADAIIALRKPGYIISFARDVEGAPIGKLAEAIIRTNNRIYIYEFLCDVEGAPTERLLNKYNEITYHEYERE